MRRRWLIALVTACIALVVLLAMVVATHDREPIYKRHPLSWWMERSGLGSVSATDAYEAAEAVGTNGLPFYVKWIQYRSSRWMIHIRNLIRQHAPQLQQTSIAQSILFEKRFWRAQAAFDALRILGPRAAPAVPELVRLVNDRRHPAVAERAIDILGNIGNDAFMPLLTCLTNTNCYPSLRIVIVTSMFRAATLSTNAAAAVPVLITLVKDEDTFTARSAVRVLGLLHLRPDIAVPALIDLLGDSRQFVPELAAEALGWFGTNATPALPALQKLADHPNHPIAGIAKDAINKITQETQLNVGKEVERARPKSE